MIISDVASPALTNEVNNLLEKLNMWFSKNYLLLNEDKTKIIRFNCHQQKTEQLQITLNNINITNVVN